MPLGKQTGVGGVHALLFANVKGALQTVMVILVCGFHVTSDGLLHNGGNVKMKLKC